MPNGRPSLLENLLDDLDLFHPRHVVPRRFSRGDADARRENGNGKALIRQLSQLTPPD